MKRDIGKAVYTIELQGAGKALQDLYSLDRAVKSVGVSFQSAMSSTSAWVSSLSSVQNAAKTLQSTAAASAKLFNTLNRVQTLNRNVQGTSGGSRFIKTGGGGSRQQGGGGIVERVLASRQPGQGLVNVPSLINQKQIDAIEKALADKTRTFSAKQREKLEDALKMLRSSSTATGGTIESLNSFVRTFDQLQNAPAERLRELRDQMATGIARDSSFAQSAAGLALQKEIDLAAIDVRSQAVNKRLSVMAGGFDRDVVARNANEATGFQSGVMGNMRLAAIKPFADNLNDALDTGKNISAMLANFQVAERMVGSAVHYVNDLYLKRVDALQQIRIFGQQALEAEIERRDKSGEQPLSPEEAEKFRSEAEVKQSTAMVPLIQQQKQYQNQLENVSAALIRVREERAKVAAADGSESELRSLEVAEASLEKQANDLRQLNTLYDQLNDAVIQLANAQRAAAANPGSKQLARDAKEAEGAYLDLRHQVNELRFAVNNVDNDMRTMAKGAKNAGFAMIQASYGVQDFIQVLAGGGGLKYALLASANNFSQVIVASDSLRKSIGGAKQAALALGVTAGMLAFAQWFATTKTSAEQLAEALEKVASKIELLSMRYRTLQRVREASGPRGVSSVSDVANFVRTSVDNSEIASADFAERSRAIAQQVDRSSDEDPFTMMGIAARNFGQYGALNLADVKWARQQQAGGVFNRAKSLAEQNDAAGLRQLAVEVGDSRTKEVSFLTDDERKRIKEALDEFIKSVEQGNANSDALGKILREAANNANAKGISAPIQEFDVAQADYESVLENLNKRIAQETDPTEIADLVQQQNTATELLNKQQLGAMTMERGTPLQRMEMETLEEYGTRAYDDLTDRLDQLRKRRSTTTNPKLLAEIDAAINRADQQRSNVATSVANQRGNMQARAFFAAQGNLLGQQMQGITEETQAAVEAAKRDLSGAQLATVLADIASADTRKRTIAQRQFGFGQESAMAGFQGQVLGAMGTPEARMAQEDLNLVGQFRDIQAMLDSGALGTGPGALAMAQDMLDMATAVSEQRKKDIEFENKKAGFSDIGSLWKQIQMSLKPDKSTQLQQKSVNILTDISNRLAQGLTLTIP